MTRVGLLKCAAYAFPPNKLEYCGPLKSHEIQAYLREHTADRGLDEILKRFETVLPYLTLIAHANGISDIFHPSVVEAYWIGNSLLNHISMKSLHEFFQSSLSLTKKIPQKEFRWLEDKLEKGACAHHSFHVLNIFSRTGHHSVKHTIETMDNCRINWGELVKVEPFSISLKTPRFVYRRRRIELETTTMTLPQSSWLSVDTVDIGSVYTYHWRQICEKISSDKQNNLNIWTDRALRLANSTL